MSPNAIHAQPLIADNCVCFNCGDRKCYCLAAETGKAVWERELKSIAVTEPILLKSGDDIWSKSLYVLASEGDMYCLDFGNGTVRWRINLQKTVANPDLFISSPLVVIDQSEYGYHGKIYFGSHIISKPVFYCLDERLDRSE